MSSFGAGLFFPPILACIHTYKQKKYKKLLKIKWLWSLNHLAASCRAAPPGVLGRFFFLNRCCRSRVIDHPISRSCLAVLLCTKQLNQRLVWYGTEPWPSLLNVFHSAAMIADYNRSTQRVGKRILSPTTSRGWTAPNRLIIEFSNCPYMSTSTELTAAGNCHIDLCRDRCFLRIIFLA